MIEFVRFLPRDSQTVRAIVGDAAEWSPEIDRLTDIGDLLAGANWQRSGGRGQKPKPTKRPMPNGT